MIHTKEKVEFYIGLEGDPGDPFTNEIIFNAIRDAGISTEFVSKKCKGKVVRVWKVPKEFARDLYNLQDSFKLSFVVYYERKSAFRHFRFFEPEIKKRAKYGRYKWRKKK